ncbi:MAG: uracil-DNA glycosylase [Hydrogenophilales bacterium 16-64-46]|nr:MAG: uracil-DNA glycosylase [Hydrogenophilales bacterium 12-64-13]OYZ04857.1 MAG: uracil-DNA glycosylase [Hydrogenophilales bacterium 16-64-46]OZA37500.1 MAG: uracil-DNA glycosylase [Hydrogenophilales bacterium 17-64-34]HQT00682.1 uracil-DNA glycosylase family protein [Thiobacillus sp.]
MSTRSNATSSSKAESNPAGANPAAAIDALAARARACTVCAPHLPHAPRPILRVSSSASLLIVGQAPGRRVHETGIPWNDASGDRLREWLGVTREVFYDKTRIAIVPAGLCYPGTVKGSDLPPRPECAPLWHPPLRAAMPRIELSLLIGAYAQAYYLGDKRGRTLADTVHAWRECAPDTLPLPHPSPRNRLWLKRNPWFEAEVIPVLRERVGRLLAAGDNAGTAHQ